MKRFFESYVGFIFASIIACLLISICSQTLKMHLDLFRFKASDLKIERQLKKDDLPVIYATNRYVYLNQSFDPLEGVYALDKKDGKILQLEIEGSVNTMKSGMYELIYKVKNSLGLNQEKKVYIWVEDYENDD